MQVARITEEGDAPTMVCLSFNSIHLTPLNGS